MNGTSASGAEKAATLLISLGPEISAAVLKELREAEVEQITMEISSTDRVGTDERQAVIAEAHQLAVARRFISSGGFEYAHQMLREAFGEERAQVVMDRLAENLRPEPLAFLRSTDSSLLASIIENEPPQAIGLILAHLPATKAFDVLRRLPTATQVEVATRIATLEQTHTDVVMTIDAVLRRQMSSLMTSERSSAGGLKQLVEILGNADRTGERALLEAMDQQNPELAEAIRNEMFVFENIGDLDDHALQRLLRQLDSKDLVVALRSATELMRERIFQNLSARAAQALREDMEASQPVRQKQIDEAQERVVAIARQLDEAGEISIRQGAEDALI